MSLLNLASLAVALLAVIGLCFGMRNGWFFGLLSLACLLGAAGEAYRENKSGGWAFLAVAAMFLALSARAAYRDSRAGRGGT